MDPSAKRTAKRLAVILAPVVLLLVLLGRWLSPSLAVGVRTLDRTCENVSGFCADGTATVTWSEQTLARLRD